MGDAVPISQFPWWRIWIRASARSVSFQRPVILGTKLGSPIFLRDHPVDHGKSLVWVAVPYIQPKLCCLCRESTKITHTPYHILHGNKMSKDKVQHVAYGVPFLDPAANASPFWDQKHGTDLVDSAVSKHPQTVLRGSCLEELCSFNQTWLEGVMLKRS